MAAVDCLLQLANGGRYVVNDDINNNHQINNDENGGHVDRDEDGKEIGGQTHPRFKCDMCGRVSKKRAHLVTHLRTHTSKNKQ